MISVPTIVFAGGLVAVTTGVLLGLSWAQNRSERSLGLWALGNLSAGLSAGLALAQAWIGAEAAMNAATGASVAAVGLAWAGTRHFERQPFTWAEVFAGMVIWFVIVVAQPIHASPLLRMAASSVIVGAYMFASAHAHWRGRGERLVSRWPAIALLGGCAAIYLARAPIGFVFAVPPPELDHTSPLLAFVASVALVHVIGISFLRLAMVRERAEANYRRVASTDELTGIANRRAFLNAAQARLLAARQRGESAALLVFDLDYFKAINDGYGHAGGDDVLIEFTKRVCALLDEDAFLARLGGEEFATLICGQSQEDVFALAENMRSSIAETAFETRQGRTLVTVSVGIAFGDATDCSLDHLMQHADMALYCAKRNGRNRIECDRVETDAELNEAA